jgi:hypothetical protein
MSWDNSLNWRPQAVQDQQWDLMAASGVESARVLFSWAAAQPTRGAINFDMTDRLVERAAGRRIQLLPVVFEAPPWAQLDSNRRNSPPRRPAEFAAYLRALVSRYGRNGTFWAGRPDLPKRPIREWQIWNEPHLGFYWNVPHDWTAAWPKGYVKLLKVARKAIRSRDKRAKIVLGGLSERPWTELKRLYRLRARRLFDVVAVHPYNSGLKNALEAVRLVRGVMRRYHDSRKPLWVTELGWPAARGKLKLNLGLKRLVTTDNGMARRIGTTYDSFLSRRKRYGVGRLYWFTWASSYRKGEGSIWNFAGLLEANPLGFVPTPALAAYRTSARRNEGCPKAVTGVCR